MRSDRKTTEDLQNAAYRIFEASGLLSDSHCPSDFHRAIRQVIVMAQTGEVPAYVTDAEWFKRDEL